LHSGEEQIMTPDKFHDECGVVAIYSHPEAETLAYLGLHALQHRGQESAGIVTSNGMQLRAHKAMGLVADIFTPDVLAPMRGTLAIGHTRYSTAGDSALLNAQPIMVQSNKGVTAVAHNPPFNYNPGLFWDADPSHRKATIPPGPNGPVGLVWIDLSKPHYGIHGTPEPGSVGYTTSHGCVRLTNWDALRLAGMVRSGTKVEFVP